MVIDSTINGGYIYGGNSNNGSVNNNLLMIENSSGNAIYGGLSKYTDASTSNNTVIADNFNGTGNVMGGSAYGEASSNVISLSGSTVSAVVGGFSSGSDANQNTIYLDGGTYSGYITGGKAQGSVSGDAIGNVININDGNFSMNIYGGYSEIGNTTNNTINISGNPVLNGVDIYGGYSASGSISGNTLNVYSKGLSAGNIYNFDSLNFYIPIDIVNDETILTLTDTVGTNLSGSTIQAGIMGGASLAAGDSLTLITNAAGITTDTLTAYGQLSEGISLDYTLTVGLAEDGNAITATIGQVSIGAGASNNTINLYSDSYTINNSAVHTLPGSINNIYGGYIGSDVDRSVDIVGGYSSGGEAVGNILNVYGKGLTANNIYNLDILNFYLPSDVKSGEVMLNLTDTVGTDLSGATIQAGVVGDASLVSGDVINLLSNTAGLTTDSITAYGKLSEGISIDYDLNIAKNDNTITATIIESPNDPTPIPTVVASASNNNLTVNNSTYTHVIDESSNTDTYSGNYPALIGGYAGSASIGGLIGGYEESGDANYNVINLEEGTFSGASIIGGYSEEGSGDYNTVNISSGFRISNAALIRGGSGSNNLINLNSGNVNAELVIGGTDENTINAGAGNFDTLRGGSGNYNYINLNGADVLDAVIGGDSNNVINLNSSVESSTLNLYGRLNSSDISLRSYIEKGDDESIGNTLNIYTKDNTLNNIYNFDSINFYLPGDTDSGDTILTLTDTAGTNISGATVKAGIVGNASLEAGDTITLLKNSTKLTATGTTYGKLSEGISLDYDLTIKKSGNQLIATLADNSEPITPTVVSSASDNVITITNNDYTINGTTTAFSSINDIWGGYIGTSSGNVNDIVGGYSDNGTPSGNILNITGNGITANNIYNFDTLNFYIPSSAVSGDTMLTLTDTAGTNISGATVRAGVMGGSSLVGGDVINLLSNSNGLTAEDTTYGKLSEGGRQHHKRDDCRY